MNNVINFIFELRSKGHNITFELNRYGYFTVIEYYNERVNGRMIYGTKKNVLYHDMAEKVGEETLIKISEGLVGPIKDLT